MTTLRSLWTQTRPALLLMAAAGTSWIAGQSPSAAQQPTFGMRNGSNPVRMNGIIPLPPAPPKGAWGEVVMANSKWLVVQNHQGQQFPIAVDSIGQFLIRWPTDASSLTDESVIEAIGVDVGTNTMRTDHVDVFEGSDRGLVSPTFLKLNPNKSPESAVDPMYNRYMNGAVNGALNQQYGWVFPGDAEMIDVGASATRMHVVANVIGNDPLAVSIGGNNSVSIVSDDSGPMTITQMTKGNSGFAEKGDVVYLMPTEMTPRTVVLSQVVLYKKMPLQAFKLP